MQAIYSESMVMRLEGCAPDAGNRFKLLTLTNPSSSHTHAHTDRRRMGAGADRKELPFCRRTRQGCASDADFLSKADHEDAGLGKASATQADNSERCRC